MRISKGKGFVLAGSYTFWEKAYNILELGSAAETGLITLNRIRRSVCIH